MATPPKFTWTISVLVAYDDKEAPLVQAYDEFEKSIKGVRKPDKNIRFVIFFYNINTKMVSIKQSKISGSRLDFKTTNLGVQDIYEPKHSVLINFFRDHVAKTNPARNEIHKQMVILWGHAIGLGFLKTALKRKLQEMRDEFGWNGGEIQFDINEFASHIYSTNSLTASAGLNTAASYKQTRKDLITSAFRNSIRDLNMDEMIRLESLFNVITGNDLAKIIKKGLATDKSVTDSVVNAPVPSPLAKVQVMLCLSCYVNMIDTAFALKDIVNVYIAPQTEIPFYGYNYKALFKLLKDAPASSEQDIAINITHHYLLKYLEPSIAKDIAGKFVIHNIDYKNSVAFSAVYLSKYNKIKERVIKLREFIERKHSSLQTINPGGSGLKPVLVSARRRCFSVSRRGANDIGIVDYENYITEVLNNVSPKGDFITEFFSGSQIISDYYNGNICRSNYRIALSQFSSQSPGSFSVFLPNKPLSVLENEFLKLYREIALNPDSFAFATNWPAVIDLLIK